MRRLAAEFPLEHFPLAAVLCFIQRRNAATVLPRSSFCRTPSFRTSRVTRHMSCVNSRRARPLMQRIMTRRTPQLSGDTVTPPVERKFRSDHVTRGSPSCRL
jgi:hypothetical protein